MGQQNSLAACLEIEDMQLGQGEIATTNETLKQGRQLENKKDGPHEEKGQKTTEPNEEEEEDFPHGPPGFEDTNYHTPQRARRSPRLHAKHSGPYISVMEKASRLKGGQQAGLKKTGGPKVKLFNKPDPKYAQTLDPLSVEQAEMVILTAGLQIEQEMGNKIASLVAEGGGQQTDLV